MIRFGCEEAHLCAVLEKGQTEKTIDIHLRRTRPKAAALQKIPVRRAADLYGVLNIVFFSPEDLNIIKDGPGRRRRFIDMELCQLDSIYMHDLSCYNRILQQRNKLLKEMEGKSGWAETLQVWDLQLIEYGEKVIRARKKYLEKMQNIIEKNHREISGGKEELVTLYKPDVPQGKMEQAMAENAAKDLRFGITGAGPHRDDITFMIGGKDLRKYGSQGQQRTAALALKLAEIEVVTQSIGERPVLLLDDVLSELDRERQNDLLGSIHNVQTIITCTGLDDFVNNRFHIDRVFHVENGSIKEKQH